jgi:hypothetical protein
MHLFALIFAVALHCVVSDLVPNACGANEWYPASGYIAGNMTSNTTDLFIGIVEEKPIIIENLAVNVRFNGSNNYYYSSGSPRAVVVLLTVNDLPTLKDFSNLCAKPNTRNGVTVFQPVFNNQKAIVHMQVFDFNGTFTYSFCGKSDINLKSGEKLVMAVYYTYCIPPGSYQSSGVNFYGSYGYKYSA